MGPNGSGKSTLAYTLMGHPKYAVTAGAVSFGGEDLLAPAAPTRAPGSACSSASSTPPRSPG